MENERISRREITSNNSEHNRQSERRKKRQAQKQKQRRNIKFIIIAVSVIIVAIVLFSLTKTTQATRYISNPFESSNQDDSEQAEVQGEYNTITFDVSESSGTSVKPTTLKMEVNKEIDRLPYAAKKDSRFVSWLYTPPGGGTPIQVDNSNRNIIPTTADVTLTPIFEDKPTSIDNETRGLPVLMYHYFYDSDTENTPEDNNFFDIHSFEEQMKYLNDNNYYYPTWDEVTEFINGNILLPEKSVVITADDGHESVFRLALPILEKYNVQATSFIIGIDTSKEFLENNTSENITFESHTFDMHRPGELVDGGQILSASAEEIKEDVNQSFDLLGTKRVYCYPYGHINDEAKKSLKQNGVQLGFTVEFGRAHPLMDPLELPRIRMSGGEPIDYFITRVE